MPELEQDGWSYDVQTAEVTDGNGLKVARDVLPGDACLIMMAPRLRLAATDALEYAQRFRTLNGEPDDGGCAKACDGLEEVLDTITAHEDQSAPRAQGARLPAAVTPDILLLVMEALEYEKDQFDATQEFYALPGLNNIGDVYKAREGPFKTAEEARTQAEALKSGKLWDYAYVQIEEPGDLSVSGGDTVDWFGNWRLRMKAAVGKAVG